MGERLADQDAGHRGLLVHDAAELLGDAEHVDAELRRLGEQLGRGRAVGVGLERGRADLLLGEGAAGLLEHLLLVVGA